MLLLLLLPAAALAQGTTFNYAGSAFQTYVAPASGWYLLDVQGAQGGPASNLSHQGGNGARMQGYMYLQQGALLRIAVGGQGGRGQGQGNNVSGGGGGGGSSVAMPSGSVGTPSPSDVILLMAGGGGGAAANSNGSSGLEFESGGPPNAGIFGHGAGVGSSEWGGAGGAGYRTNGGTHYNGSSQSAELLSTGGQAYLNGNLGGVSPDPCSFCGRGGAGGWGGGGEGGPAWSGLFSQVDGGGGGGGGYSGGGGGATQGDGAGGGGSYVSSTVDTTLCLAVRGYRSGHGLVQITPVSGPAVVQQPANQQVAIGQAVTLGPVFDDLSGQTTYAWMKDGVVLADQTSATLTIASFQSTDSGCYQAIVQQASAMCITLPAFVSPSTSLATLQGWGSNQNGELGLGDTVDRYSAVQLTSGVVTMAGGWLFSHFVKADGTLWSMGYNNAGQLGLGDTTERTAPAQVTTGVVAVAAGESHTLFVKGDGTLWSMGENDNGELGLGDNSNRSSPVQVTGNVVAVAVGVEHSLFVKRDGTLWSMGYNNSGQLGLGNNTDRNVPMQVASGVVAVAAGSFHTLFLKRDGTVWSTGANDYGQLGLQGTTYQNSPKQVTYQLNSDVVSVAAGWWHSLLVKRDGTLLGMGRNYFGELGLGVSYTYVTVPFTIDSEVVAAAGGYKHSLYVKSDGTLWSMGDNTYGQLGTGCSTCGQRLNQVYFRNSANQPTTPIVVATLPKMPTAYHSLVTAAPAVSSVQASQGGVSIGQFALALRDAPSGQYREAIDDDPSTGWSADAIYWNNQNQIRFAVRFRNSAGTNDITAFGAFTLDDPSEAEFLALRTADLRRIGVQPSANASNQARYQAFQSLMNSATLEQLRARFGGFLPDFDVGFAW